MFEGVPLDIGVNVRKTTTQMSTQHCVQGLHLQDINLENTK